MAFSHQRGAAGISTTFWDANLSESADAVDVTFKQIEEVLGFPLPSSARKHVACWYGGQPGSTVGNAIRAAGWRVKRPDLEKETVTLRRDK
jgi:hypothetical protein